MSYSIRTPNERIYNVADDPGNLTKAHLYLKANSSDSHIFGNFLGDSGRFFDFEALGNFTYSSPKLDLNDVAGTFTRFSYSYQDVLIEDGTYSTGFPLSKFLTEDFYAFSLTLLDGDDYFEGSNNISKSDMARGLAGNDVFVGNKGDDYFDGGSGIDTMKFSGPRSQYNVNLNASIESKSITGKYFSGATISDTVADRDGTDSAIDVERFIFGDATVAFDSLGNAGKAYRVYKAAFARDPMAGDKAGLGYWVSQIDKGMDMVEVAARFIDSNEFRGVYGENPSNADFLTKVYTNVLGRTPDQGGFTWWLNELNTNPTKTKAKVLADFAESQENKDSIVTLIGNGIQYTEFLG